MLGDGYTYERFAIEQWLIVYTTSPKTNEELLSTRLVPNHALRSMIQDWMKKHREDRWSIPEDRLQLGDRVVGRGAWGVVTESVMRDSQNRLIAVATKSVPDAVSEHAKKMLDRELKMLAISTSRCSGVSCCLVPSDRPRHPSECESVYRSESAVDLPCSVAPLPACTTEPSAAAQWLQPVFLYNPQ